VSIAASSLTPPERARKGAQLALQALQEPGTAASLAVAMGCSESSISRLKNEHLEHVLVLLAHLGLKVVPAEHCCVARETYEFLTRSHARVMQQAPQLIWESE
jgi:hypothetical protein